MNNRFKKTIAGHADTIRNTDTDMRMMRNINFTVNSQIDIAYVLDVFQIVSRNTANIYNKKNAFIYTPQDIKHPQLITYFYLQILL